MAPVAGVTAYSASKAYVSTLAQALSYETQEKIDVVDWVAGETSTKMLKERNNPRTVPREVAVKGMLDSLGYDRFTYGCRKHEMSNSLAMMVPVWIFSPLMFKVMCKSKEKHLEKMKKEGDDMDAYDKR